MPYIDSMFDIALSPLSAAEMLVTGHRHFSSSCMISSRWKLLVCGMSLLMANGCGHSSNPTKAYDHLIAAAEAIQAGDKEKAFAELNASIDTNPNGWAYFERARIHLEQNREAEANADCQMGLQLEPSNSQLRWLAAELKKPAPQRFKGRFARPPGR
jgi:hypothetical protein